MAQTHLIYYKISTMIFNYKSTSANGICDRTDGYVGCAGGESLENDDAAGKRKAKGNREEL